MATATSDRTYNLVSVLYHTQQGAHTHDQYIADAQQAGDDEVAGEDEVADFLRRVQERDREIGEEAQRLLRVRLGE